MCNPGSSIQNFLKHFLGTSLAWHGTKYYKTFFLNRKLFPRWLLALVRVSTKTGRFLQLLWFNLPTNLGSLCPPPPKKKPYSSPYTLLLLELLISTSLSLFSASYPHHSFKSRMSFFLHCPYLIPKPFCLWPGL